MYFKTLFFIFYLSALAIRASPLQDIFGRALGDTCKAPEGTGSCKHTADCPGISYPTNLCPKDPNDVQVRLQCHRELSTFRKLMPTVLCEHILQSQLLPRILPQY